MSALMVYRVTKLHWEDRGEEPGFRVEIARLEGSRWAYFTDSEKASFPLAMDSYFQDEEGRLRQDLREAFPGVSFPEGNER